jgi:hypothetical protein
MLKINERRLNEAQWADCWAIFRSSPSCIRSFETFAALITRRPPKVRFRLKLGKEFQEILEKYYVDWELNIYKYDKTVGIAPWYFVPIKVGENTHMVPVVPDPQSGYITVYPDSNGVLSYYYYWNNDPKSNAFVTSIEPDKRFFFEVRRNGPSLDGSLNSPLITVLSDWRTLKIFREAHEMAAFQQARLQHIFELHQNNTVNVHEAITQLESFGDQIAGGINTALEEKLMAQRADVKTADLYTALAESWAYNRGVRRANGVTNQYIRSEGMGQKWLLENSNIVEHGVALRPNVTHKVAQAPQVHAQFLELRERFEESVASLMDVPKTLYDPKSDRSSSNNQVALRLVQERIEDWAIYLARCVKKAIIISYGHLLQAELNRFRKPTKPGRLIELLVQNELSVEIPSATFDSPDDIYKMIQAGMLKKEAGAKRVAYIHGIPEKDIEIQPGIWDPVDPNSDPNPKDLDPKKKKLKK